MFYCKIFQISASCKQNILSKAHNFRLNTHGHIKGLIVYIIHFASVILVEDLTDNLCHADAIDVGIVRVL